MPQIHARSSNGICYPWCHAQDFHMQRPGVAGMGLGLRSRSIAVFPIWHHPSNRKLLNCSLIYSPKVSRTSFAEAKP